MLCFMRPALTCFTRPVPGVVPAAFRRIISGSADKVPGCSSAIKNSSYHSSSFSSTSSSSSSSNPPRPQPPQPLGKPYQAAATPASPSSHPTSAKPLTPQGAGSHSPSSTVVQHPRMQPNASEPFTGIDNGSTGSTGAAETHADVLQSKADNYGGQIVDDAHLPQDAHEFTRKLTASMQVWRAQGVRGVWLKIPCPSHAALLAPAMSVAGFVPHHAEPSYVMLSAWLPEDAPNTLPPNASHQVGVGAIVVNERGEILVVQERNGPLKGKGVWKMPTGLVHEGEDLTTGCEREVEEETGVRARFECVLAIRQAHGFAFGKSDLFVCCGLRAEPGQGVDVVAQESELEAAKWMPISEYASQQFMKGVPLYDILRERSVAYAEGRYKGMRADKLEAGWLRPRSDLLIWGEGGEVAGSSV